MNPYKEEIIHAHAAIENWLSKGMGSLEALIARFAADFTMITPGGVCLDYPALGAFFQAQRGCRPGLVIVVEHIDLVAEWLEGAALRYRAGPGRDGTLVDGHFKKGKRTDSLASFT